MKNNPKISDLLGISDDRAIEIHGILLAQFAKEGNSVTEDLLKITEQGFTEKEKIFMAWAYACALQEAKNDDRLKTNEDFKKLRHFMWPGHKALIRQGVTLAVFVITVLGIRSLGAQIHEAFLLLFPLMYLTINDVSLTMKIDYAEKRQQAAEKIALELLRQKQ